MLQPEEDGDHDEVDDDNGDDDDEHPRTFTTACGDSLVPVVSI